MDVREEVLRKPKVGEIWEYQHVDYALACPLRPAVKVFILEVFMVDPMNKMRETLRVLTFPTSIVPRIFELTWTGKKDRFKFIREY